MTRKRSTSESLPSRAFELLDLDSDGALEPNEIANAGDRIRNADTNRDGHVDFQEFDRLDVL